MGPNVWMHRQEQGLQTSQGDGLKIIQGMVGQFCMQAKVHRMGIGREEQGVTIVGGFGGNLSAQYRPTAWLVVHHNSL